jgi:hypothetical protein
MNCKNRAAWAADDSDRRSAHAARFFDRSANTRSFNRGMEAHNNPDFYPSVWERLTRMTRNLLLGVRFA